MENLIRLRDINKTYHLGEIDLPVLKGISMEIEKGEMVALMGASGSGKSTLMNILGCLDRPTSGEYWLEGGTYPVRCKGAGQAAESHPRVRLPEFQPSAQDERPGQRDDAIKLRQGGSHGAPEERTGRLDAGESRPGGQIGSPSSQPSGGEQQRVAIARSLINRPQVLFADEPTGNLDSRTSEEILQMFQGLNKEEGITIILVTHDPGVGRHADRVVRIKDGLVDGPA